MSPAKSEWKNMTHVANGKRGKKSESETRTAYEKCKANVAKSCIVAPLLRFCMSVFICKTVEGTPETSRLQKSGRAVNTVKETRVMEFLHFFFRRFSLCFTFVVHFHCATLSMESETSKHVFFPYPF